MTTLRPSSLPILAQCPQFVSSGGNEHTTAGEQRHEAVQAVLTGCARPGDNEMISDLSLEDMESVEWAADYVRCNSSSEYPMHFEKRVHPIGFDFEPLFPQSAEREGGGTLDLHVGPVLFDFKSRPRDYWPQLAAYALGLMQEYGFKSIECHILFMVTRSYEKRTLTEEDCYKLINQILANAGKGEAKPCDYCGWCAKQTTCPVVLRKVNAIVAGREDWKLEQYHASEIKTPEQMGHALDIARQMKKWVAGVEYHALEMVRKEGKTPTGYEVKPTKGKSYITDTAAAFPLSGLDQETFLKCCDVRQNTSTKYPDKIGLANALAERDSMPLSKAKKTIKERLSPVIATGKDGIKLVSLKADTTEEEGAE